MKKIVALLISLSIFVLLTVAVGAAVLTHNTIFRISTADPWVISGAASGNPTYSNWYYHTKTGTSRVAVIPTKDLNNYYDGSNGYGTDSHIHYDSASDPTVTELFGSGATIDGTWSPEIHYFSEEDFPGHSGWYMYVALRQDYDDPTGESSRIRMVVLKSPAASAAPSGKDYVHPISEDANHSQPLLDMNGNNYVEWGCGQTILRIKEGEYAGIYAMWVSEQNRGTADFFQTISIAKLISPWQFDSKIGTVTRPTQEWEMSGKKLSSTKYLPDVVEGATPIYGKNGEIFIIYCGSGYWTGGNYALGQLTWNGGDPLLESSWEKLDENENKNPIFDAARDTNNLAGAGHASFINDKDGNGFAVYHAYPYGTWTDKKDNDGDGNKTEKYTGFKYERYAFIEPYYIDYNTGIVHIGLDNDRSPADYKTATVDFNTVGTYLTMPSTSGSYCTDGIQLVMQDSLADGFSIYRKASYEDYYTHIATTTDTVYLDKDVEEGETYSYRIYSYREEEISPSCAEVEVTILSAPVLDTLDTTLEISLTCFCDSVSVFRDGEWAKSFNGDFAPGSSIDWEDSGFTPGATHTYTAMVFLEGSSSELSNEVEITYTTPAPEIMEGSTSCTSLEILIDNQTTADYDYFNVYFGEECLNKIGETSALSYTVDNLTPYATYYYAVAGVADGVEGELSEVHEYVPTHLYDNYSEGKEPTCTEDGYEEYFSCVCGKVMDEIVTLPSKGHSYELTEEMIPATEETEGKTAVYTCTGCGDSYGGDVISTIGNGDVNGDGVLSLIDIVLVLKTGTYLSEADLNGNGKMELLDILLLIKAILNS
ncbi:MAG: hypothetical protein IKU61_00340 [Clostridia bacterium]|nr:hypothetical protein [Clostridia bacterium]